MLMRSGMENKLGMVVLEYLINTTGIADRADENRECERRELVLQLLLNRVCVVLVDIKNYKALWLCCGTLPAQLRADRSAASRYENGFA